MNNCEKEANIFFNLIFGLFVLKMVINNFTRNVGIFSIFYTFKVFQKTKKSLILVLIHSDAKSVHKTKN